MPQHSRETIRQLLVSNDRAVERAILAIFERQLASLGLRASARRTRNNRRAPLSLTTAGVSPALTLNSGPITLVG